MFYEGRVSSVFQIDKDEILSVLGEQKKEFFKHAKRTDGKPYRIGLYSNVIYKFEHNGKTYGFADDASSCNGVTELAIIDIDEMRQIESLTIDWVKSNKQKAILDCCENPAMWKKTGITIDDSGKVTSQPMSVYTCGCCGTGFYSTHTVQSKFDQDSGYGICKDCERFYI